MTQNRRRACPLAACRLSSVRIGLSAVALGLTAATPALAHVGPHAGLGQTGSLLDGLVHPLTGLDHILAMVMVGVLAVRLGGRAMVLLPASFLGLMTVGGILGVAGIDLPFVEIGIALSVLVLGLAIAADVRAPPVAAALLVGLFALAHGHAHGAEMPESAGGLAYGVGFVMATAVLHGLGLGLGVLLGRLEGAGGRAALRLGGGAAAMAGIGLLAGWL